MLRTDFFKKIILLLLLGWLLFFFLERIDLVTADLGRYLQNSYQIFNGNWEKLLHTNFYSYTFPQFFFLNHHWGTGVVFGLFHSLGGFIGLHIFSVIVVVFSFFLFFQLAKQEANFVIVCFLSLILIPLIAYRNEIRPEIFSSLFTAVFVFLLWKHHQGEINPKWLWLLPFLEIFWVNLHIYFFLGIAISGAFLLEKLIFFLKSKIRKEFPKTLLVIFLSICFATLVNPFGLQGAVYPFHIYDNHGYQVLEEQSVWFLNKVGVFHPTFVLFQIVLLVLGLTFLIVFFKERKRFSLVNFFLAVGFSFMACWSVRNIALFALVSLPLLAHNLKIIFPLLKFDQLEKKILITGSSFLIAFSLLLLYGYYLPVAQGTFGIGLTKNQISAIEFFKQNQLKGPIFNNYDIGGYLIYYLFPQEKVFVDNRPETYPESFFQDVYIPMQQDESVWQEKSEEYGINTIIFFWHDVTPWGQEFLAHRVNDNVWAPVFVDEKIIIFVKKNLSNQKVIEQYQIPREAFTFVSGNE